MQERQGRKGRSCQGQAARGACPHSTPLARLPQDVRSPVCVGKLLTSAQTHTCLVT